MISLWKWKPKYWYSDKWGFADSNWLSYLWIAAQLTGWSLILFGTATPPRHLAEYLASKFPTTANTTLPLTPVLHNTSSDDNAEHSVSMTAADNSAEPTFANMGQYIHSLFTCLWPVQHHITQLCCYHFVCLSKWLNRFSNVFSSAGWANST